MGKKKKKQKKFKPKIDQPKVELSEIIEIPLKVGDLVKIDTQRIKDHPDFKSKRLVWEYRQFIADMGDKVFTISAEGDRFESKVLFMLKDDVRSYKWLIHVANLIRVEKEKVTD